MTTDNPLRADAKRNRERILIAAEQVFLERGAGASLDDIAKYAGVGIGTLYRRFLTREALLAAMYSERFLSLAQASLARDAELDPAGSVRVYLEELIMHTNLYRGLATSLGTVLQIGTPGCHATSQEGMRLLHRAQQLGALRQDVSFADLVCVATAISLSVEQEGSPKSRIAHLVGMFLNGMAAH